MPKIVRVPRKKYVVRPDNSWKTVHMLAEHGLLRKSESMFFLSSPYLTELYELLHTNMLYSWLAGDFGHMDQAVVPYKAIQDTWKAVAQDHGYFSRGGCVMQFYCDKENAFWHAVLNGTE